MTAQRVKETTEWEMNASATHKNHSVFALPVDGLHPRLVVAFARGRALRGHIFDLAKVFVSEPDVRGDDVLFLPYGSAYIK